MLDVSGKEYTAAQIKLQLLQIDSREKERDKKDSKKRDSNVRALKIGKTDTSTGSVSNVDDVGT